jgi:hypothetical protein
VFDFLVFMILCVSIGEVVEWLKARAWKVRIWQRIGGSNPSLSAIIKYPSLRISCKIMCLQAVENWVLPFSRSF